ncbi:MAG: acetyl-CoA carboxylase biotin carboxyl carrier protein subunit [Taibaiella sp.]|nr:acetyl-CoA carboxylase biotin carboxyl carrier protein subunit [Taibaiella sp.]
MLQLTVNDNRTYNISQNEDSIQINGVEAAANISVLNNGMVSILHNGNSYTGIVEQIDKQKKEVTVNINGQQYKTAIKEPLDLLLSNMGLDMAANKKSEPIKAPMPGMVLKILVSPGQQINKGDGLVILEAMKMENILKATSAATVKAIKVSERIAVEKGTVLIELE